MIGLIAAVVVTLPGGWHVIEQVSPLTGARSYIAGIDSENELVNSIGQPARATLSFSCSEGRMRLVTLLWPTYTGVQAVDVNWRFDDRKIELDSFEVLGGGTTVANRYWGARHILKDAPTAKKMVVRVQAYGGVQDAVFDMSGAAEVVTAVKAACPKG